MLVSGRIHDFVKCTSCLKPRCIFSQFQFKDSDIESLQCALDSFDYTCGSKLLPENHALFNTVFVKINQTCQSNLL